MNELKEYLSTVTLGMWLSIALHSLLFIFIIVDFSRERPKLEVPDVMTVALMDASALRQLQAAPKPAQKAPPAPKPTPPRAQTPPPPPPEPPVQRPEPTPAPKPVAETKPAPAPKPVAEAKPAPAPAPKQPDPPKKVEAPKKVEPKPAPPKRVETPPPAPKQEPAKPSQDFAQNILKTLQDARSPSPAPAPVNAPQSVEHALSGDELSTLRRQIGGCWNFPAGARNPEQLLVTLDITMNPDRTVRRATLARDADRYGQDPFFRAAAESAMRAILSPDCTPLLLPPNRFSEWQRFTITFDPRQMLGF